MTLEEIAQLLRHVEQSGLADFEFSKGNATLKLRSEGSQRFPQVPLPSPPVETRVVTAPAAGFFVLTHPTAWTPFAGEGSRVRRGQIVAFIRVGPCLRPVIAPDDGVLKGPVIEEGSLVGFGTQLLAFSS